MVSQILFSQIQIVCFSVMHFGFFDKEEWVLWHFFASLYSQSVLRISKQAANLKKI
jgi:hypothetical protein